MSALIVLVLNISPLYSQEIIRVTYPIKEQSVTSISGYGTPQINASNFRIYQMDVSSINNQLEGVVTTTEGSKGFVGQIELPFPDGTLHMFNVKLNSTMSEGLAKKFPEIRSYDGYGVDDVAKAKWDVTPQGLHAMIMLDDESTIFIDPIFMGNTQYYIVYHRKDFTTDKLKDCQFVNEQITNSINPDGKTAFASCEVRTYRAAIAATVEYTNFHGGTIALAQAAQVTTMNRVNGVYERDMGITMNIIPNNDLIVYAGATNSDPYSNGNPGTMINENQSNIDAVIGSANYDIGHVFGTNSGGLAGLGVVCWGGAKARGVTGSGAPVGDPFDIDYVAHEMGHQFGANHTQNNNCNRNNATAMEPGSASTIMGYAGICAPNVQNNSDDHFHGISLEEIGNHISSTSCPVVTSTGNSAPSITGTNGNVYVPAGTPFALTATATDADGDVLSYCWEQMDNETSTQPPSPTSTVGPNFRSNSPINNPTRYFPNLVDLAAGGPFTWEVIPTVTRTMNFRVTVRDQVLGVSGCSEYEDVTVSTDGNSGPFIVLYPSTTGIVWNAFATETVTWDVANTDQAPVSCANVDILLSTDGGDTYPITLASNVPNDGSENISVPNVGTTTARVMVICSSGTFFDVSDNDFEIVAATFDYTLDVAPDTITVCQGTDATYNITIGSLDGYNDPVTLSVSGVPAGASSGFSVNPVTPAGTSELTISNTASAASGEYTLTVSGNSTSGMKSQDVVLVIQSTSLAAVNLSSPLDGAIDEPIPTSFSWSASSEPGVTYSIEIATDAGFSSIVDQSTGLSAASYQSTVLAAGTTYYWRVMVSSPCGTSPWSSVYSFTSSTCIEYQSIDVPVTIPASGTPTVTSTITVSATGLVSDVNVTQLLGTHSRVKNLTFTLTSPAGTVVTLMDQVCNNSHSDFDIAFDDAAASAVIPCAPTTGTSYQPVGLLSDFNGENANGVWTLTITDNVNNNGGQLTDWALEVCTTPAAPCADPTLPTLTADLSICNGETTSLSVLSGTLNDAIDWQWYEGSCGGTSLGSGNSINVIPAVTTTYYVRGEGGCVSPGSCAQVTVTVNNAATGTDVISACDTYDWIDGNTYTTSNNTATHTIIGGAANGCDSIVTLNLTINNSTSGTDVISACGPITWIDGNTYSSTNNTATHTIPNAAGCDSLVTLDFTLTSFASGTDVITACDSYLWIDGNTYTTSNNTATHTIVGGSVNGCDSIVTLNLTINNATTGTDVITACDSYMWIDGNTYTTSNNTATHTIFGGAASGCDSIVTLNLTINNSATGTDIITSCVPVTWIDGNTYSTSNNTATYTIVGGAASGCDSTVQLNLTVNNSYNLSENITICFGEQYIYPDGTTGTTTGSHTSTLTTTEGCDSVIVTNLTVNGALNINVTQNGNMLTSVATGVTYQWIDCDNGDTPISGETGANYTASAITGNYAVIVSDGTCSDTSVCVLVDQTSISEINNNDISIYPNPSEGVVNIEWTGSIEQIEITDVRGRLIAKVNTNGSSASIDISNVEAGVYLIKLIKASDIYIEEIIKL